MSGADSIESRPGFAALLDRIEENGARIVLVEDGSRFALQLVIQEGLARSSMSENDWWTEGEAPEARSRPGERASERDFGLGRSYLAAD